MKDFKKEEKIPYLHQPTRIYIPQSGKNDGFNKSNPPIKVVLEQATKVVEDVIAEEAKAAFERETLTTSHSYCIRQIEESDYSNFNFN
jgi:hypothetical protein